MDNPLDYIERIGNLRRSELRKIAASKGLQLVHAEILDYLLRCNKYSNTPLALAEFLGQTKGTVSQSLKLLAEKNLVARKKDKTDGRVTRLSLTQKGKRIMEDIQKDLPHFPNTATGKSLGELRSSLKSILRLMQKRQNYKSFGLCSSCRYNIKKQEGNFECRLTGEDLTASDTKKICKEHIYQD